MAGRIGLPWAQCLGQLGQQRVQGGMLGRFQGGLVAQQNHIAARAQSGQGRLRDADLLALHLAGTGHGQVVAENRACKAQALAQDGLQPERGKPAGKASTLG